jgi:AP2 domain/HNH endonuclease
MNWVPLTRGQFTLVDDEDFEGLMQWKWHIFYSRNNAYARRNVNRPKVRAIFMHRQILGVSGGCYVDHINGDSLDNRRANLRPCTTSQNICNRGKTRKNTSGFKGVSWRKADRRWTASIRLRGQDYYLGHFPTPLHAALAYDKAARELHGEFAKPNFYEQLELPL